MKRRQQQDPPPLTPCAALKLLMETTKHTPHLVHIRTLIINYTTLPLIVIVIVIVIGLELELIQTQMTQKPMLWAEVGMRVRCAPVEIVKRIVCTGQEA